MSNYASDVVKQENDRLNKLVDFYRKADIKAFFPDGASYLYFSVDEDTAELRNGLKLTGIRNQIRRYFLGKDAKLIEPVLLVPGEKPFDFIGKYGQSILVDIYLDLKVAIK